jgi:release factor glutamine methyltransferase
MVSDLLEGIAGRFDVITANPPYLTDGEMADMHARAWPEPELALAGGADGTDLLRRLIPQARGRLAPGGSLFLEIAPAQAGSVWEELERAGYERIRVIRDLSGRDRVACARAPEESPA